MDELTYKVVTMQAYGLEAKWGRNSQGAPVIVARDPNGKAEHQRKQWWIVGERMWERAKVVGLREAFNEETLLGDLFSV